MSTPRLVPNPTKRRRNLTGGRRAGFGSYAFLALCLVIGFLPFYWSFLIGSGDSGTLRDPNRSWIPGANFLENVGEVINNPTVNFWAALRNSIIVSVTVAASVVFFSTLAGFAFAKLKFRGRGWLLTAVVATTAVPTQLGVVPLFIIMSELGWTGTIGAVIIPNLVTAFGVFWMTQYLGQVLPDELIESAQVDGANSFRTFWHIVLPSARPAAAMLGLFTFIATWTDFFWPSIVLDARNPTLPVSLRLLQANYFVDYSIVLAGALIATIPLLLLFVLAGKQLVSGIMQGAVKG
ncbi:carbohydrate ABC transporter permease (plasmid) [Herbiconiux sp. KACC 21604]|uniref:carbohydrate ABC transporter permease n=1 Tax=unclassified Herbiconiux TaxID=2618217 RepID=UPI0014924FCE|nr:MULTISPECIES: carbohydrate ABC transporter permease [unclassified Herbiconiux]QJU56321.1 carbohydrate ABC transporter permease [Herbiconiux sp. SALV-R1]WPO88828.1 carbohydrate ABC transporter permease [Herbiconiux sp. KACC 21604]